VARTSRREELAASQLTLEALGIGYEVESLPEGSVIWVASEDAARAREALWATSLESRVRPPPPEPPGRLSPIPGALVALVLLECAYFMGFSSQGPATPWVRAGANAAELTRHAEPWRAVTALTLHADVSHLVSNMVFAVPLFAFAAEVFGSGVAILLGLGAGALANWVEALTRPGGFASLGASTALFGALGLMGGASIFQPRGAVRRSLFKAVVVLALFVWLGVVPGEVDVPAHLLGLLFGLLLGAAVGQRVRSPPGIWIQWACGVTAAALVSLSWALARSAHPS
jgi:membrane associated rhomboid family serine protease